MTALERAGRWLNALNVEAGQALLIELSAKSLTETQAQAALQDAHVSSFESGALWAGLTLVGAPFPPIPVTAKVKPPGATGSATSALDRLGKKAGLQFTLRNQDVLKTLEDQSTLAARILLEHLNAGGLQSTSAAVRAASWASSWASRQGVHAQATMSSVTTKDGEPSEPRKTWIRTFPRTQHRPWHDALNGKTIAYSEKFLLHSPDGDIEIIGPYDGHLPRSEAFRCGHTVVIRAPDGSVVEPWGGDDPAVAR